MITQAINASSPPPRVSRQDLDELSPLWQALASELEKRHLIEVQE